VEHPPHGDLLPTLPPGPSHFYAVLCYVMLVPQHPHAVRSCAVRCDCLDIFLMETFYQLFRQVCNTSTVYIVLCCAMLCCAVLCFAVLCCALLCCAVLCGVMVLSQHSAQNCFLPGPRKKRYMTYAYTTHTHSQTRKRICCWPRCSATSCWRNASCTRSVGYSPPFTIPIITTFTIISITSSSFQGAPRCRCPRCPWHTSTPCGRAGT
jgi:hypothetical protein